VDVLGDASECMIGYFAAGAGKKATAKHNAFLKELGLPMLGGKFEVRS